MPSGEGTLNQVVEIGYISVVMFAMVEADRLGGQVRLQGIAGPGQGW